jgi:hypothetical protein
VGLERGPLSLVSTNKLLERKSSGSGLEIREYGRWDPSRYPQKLALTSLISRGLSVGIVRSRTKATEFIIIIIIIKRVYTKLGMYVTASDPISVPSAWEHIQLSFFSLPVKGPINTFKRKRINATIEMFDAPFSMLFVYYQRRAWIYLPVIAR